MRRVRMWWMARANAMLRTSPEDAQVGAMVQCRSAGEGDGEDTAVGEDAIAAIGSCEREAQVRVRQREIGS